MSTLRIEFVKLAESAGGEGGAAAASRVISEAELPITGVATVTGSQPAAPAGASHAILINVGGACYVDFDGHSGFGSTADPTTAKRFYVPANQTRVVTGFKLGAKFATVAATIS